MTMKKLTTEEFIEKANKIHNNKYDYSQVKYVNSRTKVCITCPQHNQFWQLANSHLQGQGCPKCSEITKNNKLKVDKETLLNKFNLLYNGKYEYNLDNMNTLHDKIKIKCSKHGWFYQRAIHHLNRHECPLCKQGVRNTLQKSLLLGQKKYMAIIMITAKLCILERKT